MILHVCTYDRFIPPFIRLVNEEFGKQNHQFWLSGKQKLKQHPIEKADNVFIVHSTIAGQLYAYLKLLLLMHSGKKLILHGLFNPGVIVLLAFCPWLLNKCYWIMWGGDLYQYQNPRPHIKDKLIEGLRKFVIKRMGHLVTYIPGDTTLARKWYGARGEYHECLMYLSNLVNPEILKDAEVPDEPHSALNILVGNSADPNNNHLESLEKLVPYREQNLRIYVPLSYGDRANAEKVIEQGRAWFGDKFIPMTSPVPFNEYLELLESMDIAMFNHKRQQAMGNTITLLGLGKTVYMRHDVTQWSFLMGVGLRLKSVSHFSLELLPKAERTDNVALVCSYFSRSRLVDQLSNLFRS